MRPHRVTHSLHERKYRERSVTVAPNDILRKMIKKFVQFQFPLADLHCE